MRVTRCDDETEPSFCWDRPWTAGTIREKLRTTEGFQRDQLVAWIMREATFDEVWSFLTPREVDECLPRIERFLGRRKGYWPYIIGAWHELGKL